MVSFLEVISVHKVCLLIYVHHPRIVDGHEPQFVGEAGLPTGFEEPANLFQQHGSVPFPGHGRVSVSRQKEDLIDSSLAAAAGV